MNEQTSIDFEEEFDEQELLLHRFVDNDLEPSERLRFFEELDRDPTLRQKLMNMERLVVRAKELPRFVPSPEFTSQVLNRLEPSQGWFTKIKDVLLAPQVLHWNPAMAMVAACAVLALTWGWYDRGVKTSVPTQLAEVPMSPSFDVPVYVRLVLVQPHAQSVSVAGDFNSWMPEQTPLQRTDEGVWTVTLQVTPGRYHYMFVVDGKKWVSDPFAEEYSLDGFGAKNAVLDLSTSL